MTSTTKTSYLIISALSPQSLTHSLIQLAIDMGCHIEESHVALLGQSYAMTLSVAGNWGGIVKLETALAHFKQKNEVDLLIRRTTPANSDLPLLHYLVQITAYYRPELISQITKFFVDQDLVIAEFFSTHYTALGTQTPMLSVNLTLQIPIDDSLAELREQFMIFCDDLNIDGILEIER